MFLSFESRGHVADVSGKRQHKHEVCSHWQMCGPPVCVFIVRSQPNEDDGVQRCRTLLAVIMHAGFVHVHTSFELGFLYNICWFAFS